MEGCREIQVEYSIRLRPLASEVPAIVRLRRFLKAAKRAYGLHCIKVEEIEAKENGTDKTKP